MEEVFLSANSCVYTLYYTTKRNEDKLDIKVQLDEYQENFHSSRLRIKWPAYLQNNISSKFEKIDGQRFYGIMINITITKLQELHISIDKISLDIVTCIKNAVITAHIDQLKSDKDKNNERIASGIVGSIITMFFMFFLFMIISMLGYGFNRK